MFTAANKKISTLVQFPIEGLDLKPYVKSGGGIYDLYAVSNHYGNLKNGHYTAYIRSVAHRKWYTYDDHKVTSMDAGKTVTKNAYVLFYRKRL